MLIIELQQFVLKSLNFSILDIRLTLFLTFPFLKLILNKVLSSIWWGFFDFEKYVDLKLLLV